MRLSSGSRRVLVGIVLVAAIAAGLEIGARVLRRGWSAEGSRARIEALSRSLSDSPETSSGHPEDPSTTLQPYTGFEDAGLHERIADDLDDYRGLEAAETFDVCILGGSAAVDLASARSGPLALELARAPIAGGRKVRIRGYGAAGYKQPQPSMLLAYLLSLGHRPDAVIELDGLDEAALGWSNAREGTCPLYPAVSRWAARTEGARFDWEMVELAYAVRESRDRAGAFAASFLRSGLWRSRVLDRLAWYRLSSLRRDHEEALERLQAHLASRPMEAELRGPRFPTEESAVAGAIVTAWEQASISMHAMCAKRGIAYLQVLQPAAVGADGADLDPVSSEGVRRIRPLLRKSGNSLRARGIAFLDASDLDDEHLVQAIAGELPAR